MQVTKGVYQCGVDKTLFLYFTGKAEKHWLEYICVAALSSDIYPRYKSSCTVNSQRYVPENLLFECDSFEEALQLFDVENYPELLI